MSKINNKCTFLKYFLSSYILIWVIATPIILLTLFFYRIPFSTNYEVLIGSIPLYISVSSVYVSAIPSYYLPASLYFKKTEQKLSFNFVGKTAFIFWGLSMLLDVFFVVLLSGINILAYPFNWIYLGVSPVMIISVVFAGKRNLNRGFKNGENS